MADEEGTESEDFEAIVAALLQVDPEGITGQTSKDAKAKKKATTADDGPCG